MVPANPGVNFSQIGTIAFIPTGWVLETVTFEKLMRTNLVSLREGSFEQVEIEGKTPSPI